MSFRSYISALPQDPQNRRIIKIYGKLFQDIPKRSIVHRNLLDNCVDTLTIQHFQRLNEISAQYPNISPVTKTPTVC